MAALSSRLACRSNDDTIFNEPLPSGFRSVPPSARQARGARSCHSEQEWRFACPPRKDRFAKDTQAAPTSEVSRQTEPSVGIERGKQGSHRGTLISMEKAVGKAAKSWTPIINPSSKSWTPISKSWTPISSIIHTSSPGKQWDSWQTQNVKLKNRTPIRCDYPVCWPERSGRRSQKGLKSWTAISARLIGAGVGHSLFQRLRKA